MKSFDDASEYEREIALLVPGYTLAHELVASLLRARLGTNTARRILVVGCGTGGELIRLAESAPAWFIDGLDPSAPMLEHARAAVAESRAADRIQLYEKTLETFHADHAYDAVLAVLVAHFITDEGPRAAFMQAVARSLRPGAPALLVDIVDDGPRGALHSRAHLDWSRARGVDEARLATMERRLQDVFVPLSADRLETLCHEAGLAREGEFFRALDVVGVVLSRPQLSNAPPAR